MIGGFILTGVTLLTIATRTNSQGINFGDNNDGGCRPVDGGVGKCVIISDCDKLNILLRRPTSAGIRKLQRSLCGFQNGTPKVCCPSDDVSSITTRPTPRPTTRPTPRPTPAPTTGNHQCGIAGGLLTRITGGTVVPLGQEPWMAVLGFRRPGSTNIDWGCGASLITLSHVLTAAHCVDRRFTRGLEVTAIRIGEHRLSTSEDCQTIENVRRCAPPPQVFTRKRTIIHPTFNQRVAVSDDIAIIELDRPATFSEYVRPICLPSASLIPERDAQRVKALGFGRTEERVHSDNLLQVGLPFVDLQTCNRTHSRTNLVPEQVCYGGEEGRDTCFGDSGGPIVFSPRGAPKQLVGLVSYGAEECGAEDKPAVYTNVARYMDWIKQHIPEL